MTARLGFDVFANDHASSTLGKVGAAFRKVGDDADSATGKLGDHGASLKKLETLSRALTNARRDEENAAGRLRVAEARLNDLRSTGKAKASQLLAAEEAVSKARRDVTITADRATTALRKYSRAQEESGDAGERAGKNLGGGFGKSLKSWFTGDGQGLFTQIGKDGGTVFGSGFLGALKTPILGPGIAGAIGAAALVALPAVGAMAGGAIVTGFGAGLAGLGLVFAAQSKQVGHEWSETLSYMGDQTRKLSVPFEDTLVKAAAFTRRTFNALAPDLGAAFQKMAPALTRFADNAGKAFERLGPAVRPVTDAFTAVTDALGPALQDAVGDVSDGMIDLSRSVKENPEGLADLTRGLGDLVRGSLNVVAGLNTVNGKLKDFRGAVSDATGGVLTVGGTFATLNRTLNPVGNVLGLTRDGLAAIGDTSDKTSTSMLAAADIVTKNAQAMQKHATATMATVGPTQAAAAAQSVWIAPTAAASKALQNEDAWLNKVVSSMSRLAGLSQGLYGAQTSYAEAVASATQSIKDNGKTLDINTAKGRANRSALNAVAQAAMAQEAAMIQSRKGVANAAVATEHARGRFIQLAMGMGLPRVQAVKLAQDLIHIPNVERKAKLTAEKRDLDAKLAKAKAQLNDKNLTRERKAKLNADIAALQAKIRAAQAAIDGLRGKTVTVRVVTVGGVKQDQSIGGGGHTPVEHRAGGGPVKAGRPYIVGENGQELFVPSGNGRIVPNNALGIAGRQKATGTAFASLYSPSQAAQLKQLQALLVGSLRSMVKAVQSSADKITNLLGKYHELEQSASSSFQGGLFGGDNAGSALSIMQRLRGQENDANAFRKALTTLKGKGLATGLFEQLAASGDVMSAIQLSQQGKGGIGALNAQYARTQRAAGAVGTYAAQAVYGNAIRSAQQQMRDEQSMARALQQALKGVQIELTGKGQAETVLISLIRKGVFARGGNAQKVLSSRAMGH